MLFAIGAVFGLILSIFSGNTTGEARPSKTFGFWFANLVRIRRKNN